MDRSSWDRIVSAAGAVVAVVLIVLGTMAITAATSGGTTCGTGWCRSTSRSRRPTR